MVEYQEKLLFCLQCHTQGLICIGKWIAVKEIPNVQQTPDCLPHFLGMSYQTTSSFKIIVHELSHTKKGETDNVLRECDVLGYHCITGPLYNEKSGRSTEACCVCSALEKGAPRPSMLTLLHNIVTQEGVAGLYRGISPNLLKVIPAVSVSYVVYEYTRIVLGVDIEGRRAGKGRG